MDALRPVMDWIASLDVEHPTRVGLDGPSAAGKTTLADALAELVHSITNRPVIREMTSGGAESAYPAALGHQAGVAAGNGHAGGALGWAADRLCGGG